ncbi:group II intron reverse transcriptase/maturase, partial [Sinorhizobium meliloti]|nr:group II intron reverse transcriptase/maturase [Sinorhizobium meliloti]
MQEARHQMPARAGRSGRRQGEALSEPGSDEATCPRCDAQSTGPGLLEAALARENLQRAWKRVKANKGAAGADGLSIEATAAHLRT